MIEYRCHKCGEAMTSPDSMLGDIEVCPACQVPVLVERPPARRKSAPPPVEEIPAATPRPTRWPGGWALDVVSPAALPRYRLLSALANICWFFGVISSALAVLALFVLFLESQAEDPAAASLALAAFLVLVAVAFELLLSGAVLACFRDIAISNWRILRAMEMLARR